MEFEDLPILKFKINESWEFISKPLKNCRIKLESYTYNEYEGVLLRIYDDYRREIVTSRNLKLTFVGIKDGIPAEYTRNVKNKDKPFPSHYYFDHIFQDPFTCEFKVHNFKIPSQYRQTLTFDIIARNDGFEGIDKFALGIGYNTSYFLNRKNANKNNFKTIFEEQYFDFWGKRLNLSKSPYFTLFSKNSTKH
jgi:hypothetical protein